MNLIIHPLGLLYKQACLYSQESLPVVYLKHYSRKIRPFNQILSISSQNRKNRIIVELPQLYIKCHSIASEHEPYILNLSSDESSTFPILKWAKEIMTRVPLGREIKILAGCRRHLIWQPQMCRKCSEVWSINFFAHTL